MSADGRDSLGYGQGAARARLAVLARTGVKSILDDLLCFVSFPAAVLEGSRDLSFLHDDSLVKESA